MLVERWQIAGDPRLYTRDHARQWGTTKLTDDQRTMYVTTYGTGDVFAMRLVWADRCGGSRGKVTPRD